MTDKLDVLKHKKLLCWIWTGRSIWETNCSKARWILLKGPGKGRGVPVFHQQFLEDGFFLQKEAGSNGMLCG